jgi:hypothetical protein
MKSIFYLLLLFTISISAQTKGVVVDENNNPIPYVNIWVENENIGTTSDEKGEYIINDLLKNKKLIFSVIGFEKTIIDNSDAQKVVLKTIVYQLDSVVISKLKNTKELEILDSKKRFYLPEPQIYPWILARKFNLNQDNKDIKYLKNIIFYTNSEIDSGNFRARIFNVNKEGFPNDDIVYEEIIIKVKKGRSKTIQDVSKYKIEIPDEGIIIGFESLSTENNKYFQKGNIENTKKLVETINFGPHILYFFDDKEESFTYRGRWIKQSYKDNNNSENRLKVTTPAINLILTN